MSKLALIFASIFSVVTLMAITNDYAKPEGFSTTPKVTKQKNIRERSVHVHGHRGFMHGK